MSSDVPRDGAAEDGGTRTVDDGGRPDDDGAEYGILDSLGITMLQAWLGVLSLLFVVFGLGSIVFPRRVYAEFVWQYFWGPVYADAHGWDYVAWANGDQVQVSSADVANNMGPVAEPGYTIYSEIGYAFILIVMLAGVAILLRRLEIERYQALFYALFPFVPLGGALRVLEDANDAMSADASPLALEYPVNTLFISPVIYFTMFFITLAALLLSLYLDRSGVIERRFEYPLAGIGAGLLALTLVALVAMTATTDLTSPPRLRFYPSITVLTLVIATAVTGVAWYLIERYAPEINDGTGYLGLLIIWGQSVDGVSNVIGLDWYDELVPVAGGDLSPKHPVNDFVQSTTGDVLPASVTGVIGDAWPFLLLKVVAAVFVVWVFDEEIFEESPRFTFMLLLAILAVGLGPGTRDMLRATFLV